LDSEIGCYLQQLRTVRRISTSQLARRAGIGRATLNRWQAGKVRPRLQELEAVLNEMAVSPLERTSALTLLSSSIKHIRKDADTAQIDYTNFAGPQPHCGDLLRALRLRNEKTQAEVAHLMGAAQATVARWERAEAWPERARLSLVAQALHVQDAEFAALTLGPHLAGSPSPCLEDLQNQWQMCRQGPHTPAKTAAAELILLKLAAQTWLPACHSSRALKLLADIYTTYAEHLYFQVRFAECEQMAQRAQEIYFAIGDETDPLWPLAVLRGAAALAQKGSRRAIERAMRQLRDGFPCDSPVGYRAWMLSEMGKMAMLCGQKVNALHLGMDAVSVARGDGDLSELVWRQEDMARIYIGIGHPQEALDFAPIPDDHPHSLFVHAEAYLVLGHPEKARRALLRASEWVESQRAIASHKIPYYRAEIQAIQAKLTPVHA
jgi:transcriptional regulator with XRE-family HTH domain